MQQRFIGLIMTVVILFSVFSPIVYASESIDMNIRITPVSMDSLDILLAAFRTLAATSDNEEPIWKSITGVEAIEPLYDLEQNIIAYYLTFEPCGYAIINNNLMNPVLMEFSNSEYTELNELMQESKAAFNEEGASSYICYGGASNLFTISEALSYVKEQDGYESKNKETLLRLDNLYSFMNSKNTLEYKSHLTLRRLIEQKYEQVKASPSYSLAELKEMYGIIDWGDMPSGSATSDFLSLCGLIEYGTTSEFSGVNGAQNHCAATAAFNVVAYYSYYLNEPNLYVDNDRAETFSAIHEYVGNGPVTFIGYNNGLDNYIDDMGYTYHYSVGGNYSAIKSGIGANRMSTILMVASLTSWHMVNAVGYREYATGTKYIRIVDGWENTTSRYILSNNMVSSYTTWIS